MNFGVVIKGIFFIILFYFLTVLICNERHESIPSEKNVIVTYQVKLLKCIVILSSFLSSYQFI